jgi:hypothetical protein
MLPFLFFCLLYVCGLFGFFFLQNKISVSMLAIVFLQKVELIPLTCILVLSSK